MEKATKDTDGFEYVDFDQKYKIGFSNSFDSLPVTEFQVTPGQPCRADMTPSYNNNDTFEIAHYLNEFSGVFQDWANNCPKMSVSQKYLADTKRYKNLVKDFSDLQFKLNKVEEDNGISKIM